MRFFADLHIHSRFSRATSRSLDLRNLDYWAARKGIQVLGTGDLTHPEWLSEIEEQLVEAEQGLFRLKPELAMEGGGETRFTLTGEISSIYKKGDKVRKVHSVVMMPTMDSARKFMERLDKIGNIRSDGRPILGLDAKDLLSICLDIDEESFFIPAHIWTPWFSLLGSKSGFDSVEECFEDLSPHIYALETGLSSDPAMNWRLSALDKYVLVSNSDAHSADKLGREANIFDTEISYPSMIEAMKGNGGFIGTVEFFPEEGKYHLDGHRKCDVRLDPEETRSLNGLCPVCGRPLTVGVYNRVLELADQPAGRVPENSQTFNSLIPLTEILGEILGVGPKSKKVAGTYEKLINSVGPELFILKQAPLDQVESEGGAILKTALERMRSGEVQALGGYDGEYGTINLFSPGELDKLAGQAELFPEKRSVPRKKRKKNINQNSSPAETEAEKKTGADSSLLTLGDPIVDDLNAEQKTCVEQGAGPLAVIAGPGTGKTMVLVRRIARLIREKMARPDEILGVTFTRQAAGEMKTRLAAQLPFRTGMDKVHLTTFHSLGLKIIEDSRDWSPKILSEEERLALAGKAAAESPCKPERLLNLISLAKQDMTGPEDIEDKELSSAYAAYENLLHESNSVDFDDLVMRSVGLLENDQVLLLKWRRRHPWILVDEYQDINYSQYRLIRLLAPDRNSNLTVIGDPDQAIYGFRGADSKYFHSFEADYPGAAMVRLGRNYRSTDAILKAAGQVIENNPVNDRAALVSGIKGPAKITTATMKSPRAEAEYVIAAIEKLIGGSSHLALDSGRADSTQNGELSFGDVAVLYRLNALAGPVAEALEKAGLPYQQSGQEPQRETDEMDFTAEKINLMTMHAAKGLEFELVFIIGLENEILPYHPPGKDPALMEEERRLFFVGMTRAKKHLFLTRTKDRTLFGRRLNGKPSPFWDEIASNMKMQDKLPDRKLKNKKEQLQLF